MFFSDKWLFLTNDLGELVSNKLLVDAVTHCRIANISCAVIFKTTSEENLFVLTWYWKVLFASWNNFLFNIKVHYCSFHALKSKLWVIMFPTGFCVVILPVVCRGIPSFMHHSTSLFICTKNRKINFLHRLLFIQAFCMVITS
jgi:hypothetical protein